jgi:hypothetical protein
MQVEIRKEVKDVFLSFGISDVGTDTGSGELFAIYHFPLLPQAA